MEAHETHEKIHEAAHGHGEHGAGDKVSLNRKIAVGISILAAALAIVEAAGKSAQNNSISANIEAANLWSFFQAKTIRMTTMETAADAVEGLTTGAGLPEATGEAVAKKVADWRATAQRYRSEPETGEGRKELAARAKAAEETRDHALASYHLYEYGAAALQIAIVLCSAATVTGATVLALGAGGLGLVGVGFGLLAYLAPTLIHL
ncbi:MAG: hypothetical protein RLZZ501_939 [Pseudomonadota bacterium]|jgi:hypothetical protein